MVESITLGIVQGITEWLPISSEGAISLIEINIFGKIDVSSIVQFALFLHLGTFFAALVYFRNEVWELVQALFSFNKASDNNQKLLIFLIISTLVSGGVGYILLQFILFAEISGRFATGAIGILLLITAYLQISKKNHSFKEIKDLDSKDAIVLGLTQAASILPGLSRSGLTISMLLLRKFKESQALTISFLMSMPIVLAGNIILNREYFLISSENITALLLSFLFGIATIHLLLKLAHKVNFGVFVLLFGLLMVGAAFI